MLLKDQMSPQVCVNNRLAWMEKLQLSDPGGIILARLNPIHLQMI